MKLSTIPAAAKVGGASVLGGTGITGTGILIHKQLTKEDLDAELKHDSGATFSLVKEEFEISQDKRSTWITVKASSITKGSKFKTETPNKWTCKITGKLTEDSVTLTDNGSSNFSKTTQISAFKTKLEDKSKKSGFIESCKKNRKEDHKKSEGWTSEIIVALTKTADSNQKYEIPTTTIDSIFNGSPVISETSNS